MSERKFGGSYQCRVCNKFHPSGYGMRCSMEILPKQKVQMSFETLECFLNDTTMLPEKRTALNRLIKELRKIIKIPEEKIYSTGQVSNENEYDPPRGEKTLKMTESILSIISNLVMKNACVKESQIKTMVEILFNLNKEVLKK